MTSHRRAHAPRYELTGPYKLWTSFLEYLEKLFPDNITPESFLFYVYFMKMSPLALKRRPLHNIKGKPTLTLGSSNFTPNQTIHNPEQRRVHDSSGSDPYRSGFKSRWHVNLIFFLVCLSVINVVFFF